MTHPMTSWNPPSDYGWKKSVSPVDKNSRQEWPFFRSMLDLIDVELGKSSPMITEHYESKTVQQVALWLYGTGGTVGNWYLGRGPLGSTSSCRFYCS